MQNAAVIGDGVEVGHSTIPGAGYGLFATRRFPKNSIITEYEGPGPRLTREQASDLKKKGKHHWIVTIDYHTMIDGFHGDDPRARGRGGASITNDRRASTNDYDRRNTNNSKKVIIRDKITIEDRLFLKATRDIESGEEITWSYMNTQSLLTDMKDITIFGYASLDEENLEDETMITDIIYGNKKVVKDYIDKRIRGDYVKNEYTSTFVAYRKKANGSLFYSITFTVPADSNEAIYISMWMPSKGIPEIFSVSPYIEEVMGHTPGKMIMFRPNEDGYMYSDETKNYFIIPILHSGTLPMVYAHDSLNRFLSDSTFFL
jgi:hypothetical protein